jgi:predicted RNA-binding protein with RPS1 domain
MHEPDATEHQIAPAQPLADPAEASAHAGGTAPEQPGSPAPDGVPADRAERADEGAGESVSAQPEGTLGFDPVTPAEQSASEPPTDPVPAPAAAAPAPEPAPTEAAPVAAATTETATPEGLDHAAADSVAAPDATVTENAPAPVGSESPQTEFAPAADPAEATPHAQAAEAAAPPVAEAAEAPASESSAPEAATSEVPAPEASAAEASTSEASAPQAATPESPASEASTAEASTSEASAPESAPGGESADVVTSEPSKKPPVDPAKAAQDAARNEERKRRAQQAWDRVVAARESGEVLTGAVTAAVKGGLLVDVGGIRGFLPASQVRVPQGTAIETLVKTKVPLKVIDIDQNRRRIVVSHRRAADEERRTKRAELLRELAVGQTREGTVVRLTDFGAFVDLGGVDGLIPMRELAFERIDKAGDVVKVGEVLPVEVLRIDENGKKISLSRRNALPDPWRDHANVLRQGQTVEGKVVAKEPRLQVELAPGVVGTVRESDANPADYEIGEAR